MISYAVLRRFTRLRAAIRGLCCRMLSNHSQFSGLCGNRQTHGTVAPSVTTYSRMNRVPAV